MNSFSKRIVNRLGRMSFGFYPLEMKSEFDSSNNALAALCKIQPYPIEDAPSAETSASKELGNLFRANGSDKAESYHNYHRVYAELLGSKRQEPLTLLEIGIGTSNPNLPSTMEGAWTPGGSLRTFRDYLPNAQVYGADVDRECLFSEERIKTFFVDQLSINSLDSLATELGTKFDLIIDDGMHSAEANLNTLNFALPLLKQGGTLVIEDLSVKATIWQVAASLLSPHYKVKLWRTANVGSMIVVVQKI